MDFILIILFGLIEYERKIGVVSFLNLYDLGNM